MSTVLLKIYFWEDCWLNYNWPSAELVQISKFKFSDLCKSKTCWNPLYHESQPAPTMKSVGRGEASGALGGQKRLPKRKKGQSEVPPLQASHCHCHALGLRMSNISVLNFTANFNPISLVKVCLLEQWVSVQSWCLCFVVFLLSRRPGMSFVSWL